MWNRYCELCLAPFVVLSENAGGSAFSPEVLLLRDFLYSGSVRMKLRREQ